MSSSITVTVHPTAIVHPEARLGEGVSVGPFSVIGPKVQLGAHTQVGAHCVFDHRVTVGARCRFFAGVIVGAIPQDLKYGGEDTEVVIGDDNTFREYVTVNLGTQASGKTAVGNGNLIMAYAHIAHDCLIGNRCIVANNGTLGGHVEMADGSIIGGLSAVHQFVRVGTMAIIGGCSKVVQDVPPYSMCDGHPAVCYGLNAEGLRRRQVPPDVRRALKQAIRILRKREVSIPHAVEEIERVVPQVREVQHLVEFVKTSSRGICR